MSKPGFTELGINSMQICLQVFLWPHTGSSFLLIPMISYQYLTKLKNSNTRSAEGEPR